MDADTRHQLKTNELGQAIEKLRNVNLDDRRIRWALIGLAVLLFLVAGYRWWRWSNQQAIENDFSQLTSLQMQLENPTELDANIASLRKLATDGADDAVRGYAKLLLTSGLWDKAARDSVNAPKLLEEIRDHLKPLAARSDVPAALQSAAAFSLGMAYESLRDFASAKSTYQGILDSRVGQGSGYRALAQERLTEVTRLEGVTIVIEQGSPPLPPPATAPATAPTGTTTAPGVAPPVNPPPAPADKAPPGDAVPPANEADGADDGDGGESPPQP